MSYNTVYTIPFKSLSNVAYLVEIQREGFAGDVTELTGAANPFTVKIDDEDFLYTPTRFSTASLKLVGNDYLQSLLSTNYQQNRVVLKREGVAVWVGFIKPEMYSQDYTSIDFELQIECMSAMSTLEFLDYKKAGESYVFVSLWDLLKKCINASNAGYSNIYLPHVYAANANAYAALTNVLESMTVSEQNFFDEDDKAMTLKEVLEEICKLLNWTCVDWRGDLYFVDVDHTGEYYKYASDFSSFQMVLFSEANIQQIGFAGSDNTLDILGGYSKASVKTSNYNVGDIFPSEDFDRLELFSEPSNIVDGNKISVKKIYSPSVYKLYHYNDSAGREEITNTAGYESQASSLLGAFPIKTDSYNMVNNGAGGLKPDIANYSFDDCIQVRSRGYYGYEIGPDDLLMEFASPLPVTTYCNGAMAINCSIQLSNRTDLAKFDTNAFDGGIIGSNVRIPCTMSVGGKYWNGVTWVSSFAKFYITFSRADILEGGFVACNNTKQLNAPYSGLEGCFVEFPLNTPLSGELKFQMYSLEYRVVGGSYQPEYIWGYFIKDLKVSYKKLDLLEDKVSENSDRIYENIVNASFVNELDEIEFKISSWNNDDISYSKALLGDDYLKDNLYCSLTGGNVRPEENLITRIIEQYNSPKIKLNQVLIHDGNIMPTTTISDNYMINKKFLPTGGEIDYEAGKFQCTMIEI